MNSKIKKGLGRGLSSLIGETKVETKINKLPVSNIVPNKFQPRKNFDEESLEDLTNSLRLLNLPTEVLKLLEEKKISAGHCKILVGLDNASFLASKIVEKKLSVRQAENLVKSLKKTKNFLRKNIDPNIQDLEKSVSDKIGLNVTIKNNKRNKGTITFSYKEIDQLNKIIDIIKSNY